MRDLFGNISLLAWDLCTAGLCLPSWKLSSPTLPGTPNPHYSRTTSLPQTSSTQGQLMFVSSLEMFHPLPLTSIRNVTIHQFAPQKLGANLSAFWVHYPLRAPGILQRPCCQLWLRFLSCTSLHFENKQARSAHSLLTRVLSGRY